MIERKKMKVEKLKKKNKNRKSYFMSKRKRIKRIEIEARGERPQTAWRARVEK